MVTTAGAGAGAVTGAGAVANAGASTGPGAEGGLVLALVPAGMTKGGGAFFGRSTGTLTGGGGLPGRGGGALFGNTGGGAQVAFEDSLWPPDCLKF